MSFDYDRLAKKADEHGSFWTSYADLFMMLTTVFLLLYVVSSLRSGTFGVLKNAEYQRLSKEAADLREQIRVYNALRDEQVSQGSEDEQKVYANLMDKLSLLKEEAKQEKEDLRTQAPENEQKEIALNKYQQIIRNIINVNVLAKGQIKRRDEVIQTKETVIEQQTSEIEEQSKQIAANNQKIEAINQELAQKIEKIKRQQKKAKMSKKAMQQAIAQLQKQSAAQVQTLRTKNEQERQALTAQLESTRASYQAQMQGLQQEHQKRLAAERAEFEKNLETTRLTAAEKAAKEAEFRKRAEAQAQELQGKLSGLQGKISGLEGKIGESEKQLHAARDGESRALATVQGLKQENAGLSDDLKRTREIAEAKKNLAAAIRRNFKNAGITADVDGKTGDVTLSFPEDYFDTGQASLKSGMLQRLKKFIPAYTKSLFSDPKTAEKIANVEIIGFASSTFKGKYVNPQSLKEKDREAVDYNLKLSFSRANSIFKFIFDTSQLQYEHQDKLLPMVKVVGRGYLPEGKQGSEIREGMPEKEFCQKYNCKNAQKVVVKFNLKD